MKKELYSNRRALAILAAALMLMLGSLYSHYHLYPYFEELHLERMESIWGRLLSLSLLLLLLTQVALLLYLLLLYIRYREIKPVSNELLPKCTIVVPAYNEGKLVYSTLISIAQSNYPKDKIEIIAVDDGSSDDTFQWIKKGAKELGERVKIFRLPSNQGKRRALYKGFQNGTGEVFVTIDSDSIIKSNTLRNLVTPFVTDFKCGAVAGNVKVLNREAALIPRMLSVSFLFSFEFIRASQSSLGFVLCTPGALSAYKREPLFKALPEWINQNFCGKVATIGEDRAMTNLILEQGYRVLFQRNATVLTKTPITFNTLHKMFTRWGRSNVRESVKMAQFIFTNFRDGSKFPQRIIFINHIVKLLLAVPLTLLMFYFIITQPLLYIVSILSSAFLFSSIQMLFYAKRNNFLDSLWAYPYSIFYLFTLFWITPYSIFTVKNGGWLTR
ncbi:MAG: glycosyltransferase family 2 protein [Bacteroidales bacterium]